MSKLIQFSRHKEKIWKMDLILESDGKKWDEIEEKLTKLKNRIKELYLEKGIRRN